MQKKQDILVLGGTGKTGRRVAQRLTQQGLPVRIGSRSSKTPFDWDNPETWLANVQDVKSVYVSYYPDLAFPGAAETVRDFAKLAVSNGVRRLVLLSGRGEEGAQLGEKFIQESGAEWTIVRASFFCQNFNENFLADAIQTGEIAFPVDQIKEPFIDAEDIAEIVAEALSSDKHVGQLYEVTGPRLMTFAEATAEISKAAGREIRYIPVTPEQYAADLREHGVPEDFAAALIDLFTSIFDGHNAYVADGVRRALGREPRDFTDFARSAAASSAWK